MVSTAQSDIRTPRDQLYRAILMVRRSSRHVWKGVLVVALGIAISLCVAVLKKRLYLSETVILYRQIISASYLGNPEASTSSDAVQTDIGLRLREILLARPRLQQIIERYNLYPELRKKRGRDGQVDAIEAVDYLRRMIAYRVGGGDTFHIAFRGPTPEVARDVTKDLADSLIEAELRLRTEQVNATQRFLEVETTRLQAELQKDERALAEFLANHPEFAQEQVSGTSLIGAGASIRAARVRQRAARREDSSLHALKRQADRMQSQLSSGSKVVVVPPDPQLVAAKEAAEGELREAQSILARKQAEFTDKHPDVVAAVARMRAAQARVARVRQTVKAASKAVRRASPMDQDAMRRELANIERQIASLKNRPKRKATASKNNTRADRIVATETEWTSLNRKVVESRERYLRLETRQFRATMEANSELSGMASQMRIVDPPYLPTRPAGVGRTIILLGGTAVSCLLGMLLLLGFALFDERIYDQLDLQRLELGEVLVEVPHSKKKAQTIDRDLL